MILSLATEKENSELCQFYSNFPLKGWIDIKPKRDDFFGLYKALGQDHKVYSLRDESTGKIEAVASFYIRESMHKERRTTIAMATDLRVSNSRNAILKWSQHFLPVLNEVKEKHGVEHIFSSINLTDPTALNTFIRPRAVRRPLPRYYLYRKFDTVTIHGKFPWGKPPLSSVRIRKGSSANYDALLNYLARKSKFKAFPTAWDQKTLENKFKRMPQFNLNNFHLAFDAQENIVGTTALWSPQSVSQLIPLSYSLFAHNFRQFLKFGKLFGWTKPLTKPVSSTGLESALEYQFMTHLHARNEDVFESLIYACYESIKPTEFLMYNHTHQDFKLRPPQNWIAAQIPHALYCVLSPNDTPPDFLHPNQNLNPELELIY